MSCRSAGVEVTPHPLAPLAALAARSDLASPLLAGRLTATYPRAFNEQLLREEIVNYPNQGVQLATLTVCRALVTSPALCHGHLPLHAMLYSQHKRVTTTGAVPCCLSVLYSCNVVHRHAQSTHSSLPSHALGGQKQHQHLDTHGQPQMAGSRSSRRAAPTAPRWTAAAATAPSR